MLAQAIGQAGGEPLARSSTEPKWVSDLSERKSSLERSLRSDLGLYGFKSEGQISTRFTVRYGKTDHQETLYQTDGRPTSACSGLAAE